MSIHTDLLFLHGHIADPGLARQLASPRGDAAVPQRSDPDAAPEASPQPATSAFDHPRSWRYPMRLFQALLPQDESSAVTIRPGSRETKYSTSYGNRTAWARRFPSLGTRGDAQCPRPCEA